MERNDVVELVFRLIERAANAKDSADAMRLAQAALNASHALSAVVCLP